MSLFYSVVGPVLFSCVLQITLAVNKYKYQYTRTPRILSELTSYPGTQALLSLFTLAYGTRGLVTRVYLGSTRERADIFIYITTYRCSMLCKICSLDVTREYTYQLCECSAWCYDCFLEKYVLYAQERPRLDTCISCKGELSRFYSEWLREYIVWYFQVENPTWPVCREN